MDRLKELLSRFSKKKAAHKHEHLADAPVNLLLENRILSLERQLEELKTRLNGLLFAVVGAVVVQVILGLLT